MGASSSSDNAPETPPPSTANVNQEGDKKPQCKPCCACPETRKPRDACIMEKGQENCSKEIEAHKECMRSMGFKV